MERFHGVNILSIFILKVVQYHFMDYFEKLKERLLTHAKVIGKCWIWQRKKISGYGMTTMNGKNVFAHRISYLLFVGEIPEGMMVCRECGNKLCINPEHLYLKSRKKSF